MTNNLRTVIGEKIIDIIPNEGYITLILESGRKLRICASQHGFIDAYIEERDNVN